jgi:exodeoxyribonuclease VII small subunit
MSDTRAQSMPTEEPSFEDALDQLEAIVSRLESGELSLDESLRQFEEGIRLSRLCSRRLDDAETKIHVLVQESGLWQARPFDPEAGFDP